ncbi:MAG: hypothetical protein KatS3mg035_1817 [Bacteroidia bacterium]|nr:MAG: hypothetical protein KatS3mg035_1817 [Bacteroidia bacterium]
MKNLSYLFVLMVVFLLRSSIVLGDSPITSTYWAEAYKDVPIIAETIKKVKGGNQVLSQKELDFLMNSKNPIAHRLSLINANSWNIDGLSNAPSLLKAFLTKYKVNKEQDFLDKADSYDLIVYAYCLAMDDYFDVIKSHEIATMAYKKNQENEKDFSYAVGLVYGIISCQIYLNDMNRWCNIYKIANNLKTFYDSDKFKKDFKEEAAGFIYEYLFIYKDTCN